MSKELKFTTIYSKEEISISFSEEPLFSDPNTLKTPVEIHGWVVPKKRRSWNDLKFRGKVINITDPGDEQESIKSVI